MPEDAKKAHDSIQLQEIEKIDKEIAYSNRLWFTLWYIFPIIFIVFVIPFTLLQYEISEAETERAIHRTFLSELEDFKQIFNQVNQRFSGINEILHNARAGLGDDATESGTNLATALGEEIRIGLVRFRWDSIPELRNHRVYLEEQSSLFNRLAEVVNTRQPGLGEGLSQKSETAEESPPLDQPSHLFLDFFADISSQGGFGNLRIYMQAVVNQLADIEELSKEISNKPDGGAAFTQSVQDLREQLKRLELTIIRLLPSIRSYAQQVDRNTAEQRRSLAQAQIESQRLTREKDALISELDDFHTQFGSIPIPFEFFILLQPVGFFLVFAAIARVVGRLRYGLDALNNLDRTVSQSSEREQAATLHWNYLNNSVSVRKALRIIQKSNMKLVWYVWLFYTANVTVVTIGVIFSREEFWHTWALQFLSILAYLFAFYGMARSSAKMLGHSAYCRREYPDFVE
jgi:hypothetical protein